MKQVANSLKIELANYRELQAFSQFGSDLDEDTKRVLTHGKVLMEVLKQDQYDTYSVDREVIELFAAKHRYLEEISVENIKVTLNKLYEYLKSSHQSLIDELNKEKKISEELEAKLHKAIKDFFELNK